MHIDIAGIFVAVGTALSWLPGWVPGAVLLVVAALIAIAAHNASVRVLLLLGARSALLKNIVQHTRVPIRVALIVIALGVVLPATGFPIAVMGGIGQVLLVAAIALLGWGAVVALEVGSDLYLRRFHMEVADNLLARKHVTQVRILRRALTTLIVVFTVAIALMTFTGVRQYGISLFASAGVAGVIFGLAAQPVLSNLIAGVQLAVTQPIRLEDAVTVQNEFGWIEEINATYVVIRLWDLRRLIVPLNYFIQQPFHNWTREAANTIGSALIYLDYTAPVDLIRHKAIDLVSQSGRPDTEVANVQITNLRPDCIELRVLIRSDSPGKASDACAELRERLIGYLQREHPEALPRQRSQTVAAVSLSGAAPAPAAVAPADRQ